MAGTCDIQVTAIIGDELHIGVSLTDSIQVGVALSVNNAAVIPCPEYNLIDGGTPSTTYVPIEGFDFISGGTP